MMFWRLTMLAIEEQPRGSARTFSPLEQGKALGVILREEFGVPFAFYDARTGAEILQDEEPLGLNDAGEPAAPALDDATVRQLALDGRARVLATSDGGYQVALLLYEA